MAPYNALPAGTSGLFRHLCRHPQHDVHLLPYATAEVTHRLRSGRETAADGDELAEVCFRTAGRAGAATRHAQLGLAAALLAHLTGWPTRAEGVTRCDSCDAPALHDRWPAVIRSYMRPGVVRTVTR